MAIGIQAVSRSQEVAHGDDEQVGSDGYARDGMTSIASVFEGLASMEAKLVDALPDEPGWQFEPKWDGFRALMLRDGDRVTIKSKSGKPLDRYFPELVALLAGLADTSFILDGEIVLPQGDVLSFDALQARLHPAASRIARLARETPAQIILFDCLWIGGRDQRGEPLAARRAALERFHGHHGSDALRLSPISLELSAARDWLAHSGGALDGVIAKRCDAPYQPGVRAMLKVKQRRTADCVVAGFRYASDSDAIGSLLLGLYDDAGKLNHVGFISGFHAAARAELTAKLAPYLGGSGFTGKAPGAPSRWSNARSAEWVPLKPELVVEVLYDQVTGDRFRHGTRFLRWRPDKAPAQCTFDQLLHALRPAEIETLASTSLRQATEHDPR